MKPTDKLIKYLDEYGKTITFLNPKHLRLKKIALIKEYGSSALSIINSKLKKYEHEKDED